MIKHYEIHSARYRSVGILNGNNNASVIELRSTFCKLQNFPFRAHQDNFTHLQASVLLSFAKDSTGVDGRTPLACARSV